MRIEIEFRPRNRVFKMLEIGIQAKNQHNISHTVLMHQLYSKYHYKHVVLGLISLGSHNIHCWFHCNMRSVNK